jgi:hypothetical protein
MAPYGTSRQRDDLSPPGAQASSVLFNADEFRFYLGTRRTELRRGTRNTIVLRQWLRDGWPHARGASSGCGRRREGRQLRRISKTSRLEF